MVILLRRQPPVADDVWCWTVVPVGQRYRDNTVRSGARMQDVRYAARALRRNPGFTAVVGMNTAVFSVANTVLFRALPYPDADRLAWLTNFSLRENRDIFTANAQ